MNKNYKIVVKIFYDKTREAVLYRRALWFKLFWCIEFYKWIDFYTPYRSRNDYEVNTNSVMVIYWHELYDPVYKCYKIARREMMGTKDKEVVIKVIKFDRDFKIIVKKKLKSLKDYEEFK